mgnify:CR=1 FL=1
MVFKEAYEALKQGAIVKLPEWSGYWKWEDNSIKMHCKDGKVLLNYPGAVIVGGSTH